MRVEGRCSGGGILRIRQRILQLRVFRGPGRLIRVKCVREAAPAHIAGKRFLFLRRCRPVLGFQLFQCPNSIHVGAELGLGAALAKMVIRNMIVFGWRVRFTCADGLDHDVIGKIGSFRGIDGNCAGLRCRRMAGLPSCFMRLPRDLSVHPFLCFIP